MTNTVIKQILAAREGWHLVLHDEQAEGARMIPVACFALVEEEGRTAVAPMVPSPDGGGGGRLVVYGGGDPVVVGLAAPGEDAVTWSDIASELRRGEREIEARREARREAESAIELPLFAGANRGLFHAALRAIYDANSGVAAAGAEAELFKSQRDSVLVRLSEHHLVDCDGRGSDGKAIWSLSLVGREALALLDKRRL